MNQSLRENKQSIRSFMQNHYTDSRLAELLCHARDGKLDYFSCCCFIGVATADHPLQRHAYKPGISVDHYDEATKLSGAKKAEIAYCGLAHSCAKKEREERDICRRRILIPMVRTEMKRRDLLKAKAHAETEVESLQNV